MGYRIKNYTSTVPAHETIGVIEQLLLLAGAVAILKEYVAGKVFAISFKLKVEWGEMPIQLPANAGKVFDVFLAEKKATGRGIVTISQKEKMAEQAERTAWKLMEDWVRVQLSLIRMKQADAAQVFLPYLTVSGGNNGQPAVSMYNVFREQQLNTLKAKPDGATA